ncbi:unnamed protein product [Aphanomyces euteiches]|uniref:Peptidase M16 N-terminal domain-containing protein n=1 Tax=Aphanomyces euteiches TaxID=100861 RepID=A0A6G0XHN0_9STRA|nr:hypothetical protein Ae201684_004814 [Aphanomyces euteiches]KAH9073273.1 hypothetical protein Ae201684P_015090 [Aphanomyces euteiches]KAH9155023.1 hypothetical protein AeRB84_002961 [Aphanomyces euteiches]
MEKSVREKGGLVVSAGDEREYRHFELENGLCVLLVSDPEAEKSAAAMDVRVGHQSDPEHLLGLAHFLEHMLFMGTEKYPDENSYSQYLSAHGGSSNAYTSGTDTNFYFDVRPPFFEEALDRFAQFFIAPLFTISATEREMNAVNSENNKNLQSDPWRLDQVIKHTSSRRHPFNKFGTGNLVTLGTTPNEEVRAELLAFHAKYYSARIMKLVIVGKEDLDTLERWARSMFSPIRDTGSKTFEYEGVPFEKDQLQRRINVVPVKDLRTIEVSWPLPPLRSSYLQKPASIISHLLGHEGAGSLLSFLKRQKWVNELSAGLMKEFDDWSLFCVEVEATEEGMKHVDDIVYAIFQYLHLLKEDLIPAWVFDETQSIALMNFRFRSKETPMNYATSLASKMQIYPVKHIVAGSSLLFEYDADKVREILALLTPERVRLMVVSKEFQGKTTSVEPWYEAAYNDLPIAPEVLQRWTSTTKESSLAIPHPNAFIPRDFELVKNPTEGAFPTLLRDDASCRLWCKTDTTFLKPKLNICMAFHSPEIYTSPAAVVLTDLLVRAVKDQLTEYTYDAELAGMRYSLNFTTKALELYGGGYSDKLPVLFQLIVKSMVHFHLDEETFLRIHDKTKRSYDNFERDDPYKHALYFSSCLLEDTKWTVAEKAQVIDQLTLDDLLNHAQRIFRNLFVEGYYHGNVDADTAQRLMDDVLTTVQAKPVFTSQRIKTRAVMLSSPVEYIYSIPELNAESVNSGIYTVFQLGPESIQLRALNEIFAQLVKEPCFNQLRTIEQLGYIVFSSAHRAHGVEYFRIIIQSDVASPAYVERSIEAFFQSIRAELAQLSPEEFQKNIQAVVDALLEKPKTASEECSRFWEEISSETYVFSRRQDVAAYVRSLALDDVLAFFDESILGPKRSKCSVHMLGHQHVVGDLEANNETPTWNALGTAASAALDNANTAKIVNVKDIRRFKLEMPLFPERASRPVQVKTSSQA